MQHARTIVSGSPPCPGPYLRTPESVSPGTEAVRPGHVANPAVSPLLRHTHSLFTLSLEGFTLLTLRLVGACPKELCSSFSAETSTAAGALFRRENSRHNKTIHQG